MIYVLITYKGNDIISYQVTGHAGFAPQGEGYILCRDICSSTDYLAGIT
jgi:uncharacterized protein YsxB (DUF464 family)